MNIDKKEARSRTELLLGEAAMERLSAARIAIFGVGGVGGYALEALARAGIGRIAVIDADRVSISNLNRQILATRESIGMLKTDAAKERAESVSPDIKIDCFPIFYSEENSAEIPLSDYDYIIDAIDTVSSKIFLIEEAYRLGIPIISSMGAGNKLDPTAFKVADIYKTSVCPLARVMRTELKKRGVKKLKCVYSEEIPIKVTVPLDGENGQATRHAPASISTVPSAVGLIIAAEVIKDLTRV